MSPASAPLFGPHFASPTPEAHRNWSRLARRSRLVVLAQVLERILADRATLLPLLGDGVVSVGCGHRLRRPRRGGPPRRVADELVLTVTVAKKRDVAELSPRSGLVPRYVEVLARPPGAKRSLPVAIPTDVSERVAGLAADGDAGKQAIVAYGPEGAAAPGREVSGTACCVVRSKDGSATRYLLGCHHVVRRSLLSPDASPVDPAAIRAFGHDIGVVGPSAPFGEAVPDSLDAALVRLNAHGQTLATDKSYWRRTPAGIVPTRAELVSSASEVFRVYPSCDVPGSAGADPVQLKFVRIEFGFPIAYDGGGNVSIAEVAIFHTTPASATTLAGFSGAPVVVLGRLAGMHIAGDFIDGVYTTAMIPMYQLVANGAIVPAGLVPVWPAGSASVGC